MTRLLRINKLRKVSTYGTMDCIPRQAGEQKIAEQNEKNFREKTFLTRNFCKLF